MDIPVIRLNRVFHVGSMDAARRGENSGTSSQEGACLSVSLCPNAWASIARLGDDLHVLTADGGTFLDVVELMENDDAWAQVLAWAQEDGLVEMRTLWRAWFYDDEAEDWRFMLCASEAEAFEEICGQTGEDYPNVEAMPHPEGGRAIESVEVPVAKSALCEMTGFGLSGGDDASHAAAVAFAMTRAEEVAGCAFDGVWWREIHEPALLSSPRGGIFQSRVARWTAVRGALDGIDDDVELDGMPESEDIAAPAMAAPGLRGG